MDPDPQVADDLVNSMHFWPLSILGSSAGIGMGKQGGSLSQVALLKRSGLVTTEHLFSFASLDTGESIDFERYITAPEIWWVLTVGVDPRDYFLGGFNLFELLANKSYLDFLSA